MKEDQIREQGPKTFKEKVKDIFEDISHFFFKPKDPCDPQIPKNALSPPQVKAFVRVFNTVNDLWPIQIEREILPGGFLLKGIMGETQLKAIFGAHLAESLYSWFVLNKKTILSENAMRRPLTKKEMSPLLTPYSTVIDLNTFLLSMEALLRSFGFKIWLQEYQGLTALEMLLIVVFGKGSVSWLDRAVNQEEIRSILELIFSLVTPHADNKSASQILSVQEMKEQVKLTPSSLPDSLGFSEKEEVKVQEEPFQPLQIRIPGLIVEPFIEYLFRKDKERVIKMQDFLFQLRTSFPRINRAIIQYFESRTILHSKFSDNQTLYDPPIAPHIPPSIKSKFLNPGSLAMLYLSIDRLRSVTLTLLYSSEFNGFGVNRLAYHWTGYNAPTLLIIEARDQNSNQKFVFGVYCDEEMKDRARFHGTNRNCFFTLEPKFSVLRATGEGKNYQYLNSRVIESSIYGCGLGFGGEYSDHRIWIDGSDIENKSHIRSNDETYEEGNLVGNSKSISVSQISFQLKRIELWGLGTKENLAYQQLFREQERQRKQQRATQKEEMLNNEFDKQFLLGNTFNNYGWQQK